MLWSLLVSAYVIYLYRKLNASESPEEPQSGSVMSAVESEIAKLDDRINALESRLSSAKAQEPAQ